jgi:hypothetical protein
VPSAGDKAAEGTALGRLGICMKRLWVKLVSEGNYLMCPDRDSAKVVYVAFNISSKYRSEIGRKNGISASTV